MSIFTTSLKAMDYRFFEKIDDREFDILLDYNYKYKLKSYQKIKCKLIGYYFNKEIKEMQLKSGLYSNIIGSENVVNCIFNSFIEMVEFGYECDKNIYCHNITEFLYRNKIPREFEKLINSILIEYLEMSLKIFTNINHIGESSESNIYNDLNNLLLNFIIKIYPNIIDECKEYFDNEIDKILIDVYIGKNEPINLSYESENTKIWAMTILNYLLYRLSDYCTNTINILLANNKNNVFEEFDNIINKYKDIDTEFFKEVFTNVPCRVYEETESTYRFIIFNHADTNLYLDIEDFTMEYKDNIKYRIGVKVFIINGEIKYDTFNKLKLFIFKKINEIYGDIHD